MKLYPNCKINVGLKVVRKREDGYHDLETVFYPIMGLHDELEVTKTTTTTTTTTTMTSNTSDASNASGYRFTQEGIVVDCPEDKNLIIRCYRMFREEFGEKVGAVDIRFRKCIPFGAGLGGGSSDAAHMAIALNELFCLGLSKAELAQRVARLGADCAFFIYNSPCFAEGIGDVLTEIDFPIQGKRIIIIKPNVGVSTRDAYSGIQPRGERLIADGDIHHIDGWQAWTNDFETTVFAKYPVLAKIKQRLLDAGAIYAAMSGSGSTIYGLFEEDAEGSSSSRFAGLYDEFAPMIILNDTL